MRKILGILSVLVVFMTVWLFWFDSQTGDTDLKNFPSTLFFTFDDDWIDMGDYYESSEPIRLRCYDFIKISNYNVAKMGNQIKSEGGNTYTISESIETYQSDEGYVGELLDKDNTSCEIYALGNEYGVIQSNERGKVCVSEVSGSYVPLRILKTAIVTGEAMEKEVTADDYLSLGLKDSFEKEWEEQGFEVVYYPIFGEGDYIISMHIGFTTPSLGY